MASNGERLMARAVAMALLKAGHVISVNDGYETVLKRSTDVEKILKAMFSTEEDYLYVHPDAHTDALMGWVRFIYGNDPWEVVNDHTTNLEAVLAPVIDDRDSIADRLENHKRVTIADLTAMFAA